MINILKFKKIDSTNNLALENFEKLQDRTIVTADMQTHGKGRFDRVWVSECFDNIYMSFVLKPEKKDFIANLTQYLSVTAAKVISSYGLGVKIKWPNDLLIDGKKVSGILCESFMEANIIKGVVLGIGVNLNMPESTIKKINKPVTSLNLELNKKVNKDVFFEALIKEFFKNYDAFLQKGFLLIKDDYLLFSDFLNKSGKINGREYFIKSVNDDGSLVLLDNTGFEKTVYAGDLESVGCTSKINID
jgi:BirA family biotin operon repressor/biotin-[acetyl-CoA-carboxylase] ligase